MAICEETGDLNGQAVAANFIGTNYMFLCSNGNESMLNGISSDDPVVVGNLQQALIFHEKHMR